MLSQVKVATDMVLGRGGAVVVVDDDDADADVEVDQSSIIELGRAVLNTLSLSYT